MCYSSQGTYSLMWQRDDLIVRKCVTVGSAVKKYREVAAHGQCGRRTGHCGHVQTIQGQLQHWLRSPEQSPPVLPSSAGRGRSAVLGTQTAPVGVYPISWCRRMPAEPLFIHGPKRICSLNSRSSSQSIGKMRSFVLFSFPFSPGHPSAREQSGFLPPSFSRSGMSKDSRWLAASICAKCLELCLDHSKHHVGVASIVIIIVFLLSWFYQYLSRLL